MSLRGVKGVDSYEQRWLDLIAEYGHTVLGVADAVDEPTEQPPFAYSTGAFESYGAPELIVFGLAYPISAEIINDVMAHYVAGRRFRCGVEEIGLLAGNHSIIFLGTDFEVTRRYVLRTERYYQGDKYPLWQMVWPALNGVFPWEPDCPADVVELQPNLTGLSWSDALERDRC